MANDELPTLEIEITPEMIEAACVALREELDVFEHSRVPALAEKALVAALGVRPLSALPPQSQEEMRQSAEDMS